MKKKTDMAIDDRPAPTECWVRKGDAIVDDVNGYSSNDWRAQVMVSSGQGFDEAVVVSVAGERRAASERMNFKMT